MLKRVIAMALTLSLLAGVPFAPQVFADETGDVTIYDMMTEDLVDPIGVDDPTPTFSWKMASKVIGQKQTAYQLTVKQGEVIVWDSGKVDSDESVGIVYGGQALTSSTEYTWSVTVWDKDGQAVTSPTATFETALLEKNAFDDTAFISYQAANDVTDYTIDLDFVITKGAVSPVFGATDASNLIMWQINVSKNQIRPHFREGGSWVAYPGKSGSIYNIDAIDLTGAFTGLNNTHHLRLVVRGTTIETWMGANEESLTKIGTYTHTKAIPLGLVGVRQAKAEAGWFDNFTVTGADGKVLYQNTFSNASSNDIAISAGAISDGWLKMDGSAEVVCLQKGSGNNLPAYRKSITVGENLVSAKLYTAGLGVYESYINGVRVGHQQDDGTVIYDELKPGFTQRNKRQFYSTFDVTRMLQQGENVLGGVVTGGWWTGVGSLYRGTETAYLAKLILTYADGTQEVINTDTTWKSAKAAAVQSGTGIYAGERYDASVDQSWMLPGYDDGTWGYVKVNTEFDGELDAWDGVSIIVRQDLERTPKSMTVYSGATGAVADTSYGDITVVSNPTDGETITLKKGQTLLVNFGQNFAGWEYFEIEGAKGTVVTVEHGEWLNEAGGSIARGNDGPGGSIYNANYRSAAAKTAYTMGGNGIEKYHPTFSFYGFQYIEITATADITVHKVRGQVVTSVHNDTATMETSDKNVNQLLSNIRWGMYSNYLSVPTDCPQRNERHGWTGDSQVFSQAGTYLTYSKSFLEKYMQDLRDAQADESIYGGVYNGAYSDIAPYTQNYGTVVDDYGNNTFGEVGWGDAGIIIPWTLYMMYGDTSTILEHWDSMRKYMDVFLESSGGSGFAYGAKDHLNLENTNKQPVGNLLAVAFFAWDALMMADMATAIGDTEAATHYMGIYEREKQIFQEQFVNEDGSLTRYEQTAQLYALYLDLLPNEESVAVVTNNLISSIESYGNNMYTGFLGTSIITKTLTKIGRSDVAYTLLLQESYPSWLYSVNEGATTIWERWNTYTAANGFGDVSMNSFNHYSYGAVAGWMYQTLAGIGYDTENPGFKNIILAPAFDDRLPEIKSSYDSVYGVIETETVITEKGWTYKATIPANTTATVKLPAANITVNGKALSALTLETDGIVYTGTENGTATFSAVAGSFAFSATTATQLDWSKPQYCQHCKKEVTWTAYSSAANLTSGHYYLANDITTTLTDGIGAASNGKMSCVHLNGKTITCTTGNRVFNVAKNRTLNIMDHPENQGALIRNNSKGNRGGIFNITDTGIVNVYGGNMMLGEGCTGSYGALVYANGTCQFNLYGGVLKNGVIASNAAIKKGGSIYAEATAQVLIEGGTIMGGSAPEVGGNIYAQGTATVTINGGNILWGEATTGGNIYMNTGTTLTIGKAAAVKYGTATAGGNIALVGAAATISGEVSYGNAIGTASTDGGANIHIDADSSCTMEEGSLVSYGKSQNSNYGGNIHNYGTFIMNGGRLEKGHISSASANICNRGNATFNGGFVGTPVKGTSSILTMSSGKTYINGGTFSGILLDGTGYPAVRVWDGGKLYISGGNFTGGQVTADKHATVEISGGAFTGSAVSFVLNSAAKGNGTLKISGGNLSKLILGDNSDSYTVNVTLSGKTVIDTVETTTPVTVSGLTEGASITFANATEGATFGTGDSEKYIYSDIGLVAVLDGTNLKWAAAKAVDGNGIHYASLQSAIDSGSAYVKLIDDVTENVTISDTLYLDLNGKTLTGNVTGAGTLYGMDTATDKYSTENMGRITGTVSCNVEKQFKTDVSGKIRRYMAIADDTGYTFHRFWLGVTHINLKPGVDGVGYKAAIYGDEQVQAQVAGYGYTLWIGENGKKLSAGKEGSFVSGKTVTARLQNFDVASYGEETIYGSVYLTLQDGTTIESASCSYTFRNLVEQIAANASSYTDTQLSALRGMLERFESTTSRWNIQNLY